MAIEYTDVLHDKILKPLQGLIAGEFPGIAIHYKLHNDECIMIRPTEEDSSSLRSKSLLRVFGVLITYHYIISGIKDIEMYTKGSEFVERLKRLIDNNTAYDGTTYFWHDGKILDTLYEIDEDDEQHMDVLMNCEFTHEDVRA